jgi:hypothetical protein
MSLCMTSFDVKQPLLVVTTKVVNHTKWNETTSLPPSCPIQRKKMSESDIYFLNNNIALFIIICCNNRPWSPRLKQWLFNIKRCHAQGHVANTIKIITYLEIVTQRHKKKYIKIQTFSSFVLVN